MLLGKAVDRVLYGSVVESDDFDEYRESYEDFISGLEDVDVGVYEWIDPVPDTSSILTPTRMRSGTAEEENLNGDEAWDFANEALEEFTPNDNPIEEIPFYFEHRSRLNNHNIKMGVSGRSSLGSRREYLVNFNGRE